MENKKVDIIVVGAGPAGVSAAVTAVRAGKKVLLVDRGDFAGAKNMFGGCIYAKQTAEIFPRFWETAPVERAVTNHSFIMLSDFNSTKYTYNDADVGAYKAFTVIRAKWDKWCVEQAVKEGVYFAPKTLVKELLLENGKVVGIQTQFEKFYCNMVIIADGVNSLLAKQIGLRKEFKDSDVTLCVKEVIKLPYDRISDRFNVNWDGGSAVKIFGGPLKDVFAMGFMYTNKESISIGYGISLDELKKLKITPYELLDDLKNHPGIQQYIKDGEVIEYSSHLIPDGRFDSIPKVYDNRVLIAGDAAGFVNNVHLEGTNLAMLSGKLAGETAVFALNQENLSALNLSRYYEKLQKSIIIKDLKTHNNTIDFLKKHIKTLTSLYPELACNFFEMLISTDGIPKSAKYRKFVSTVLKSGVIPKSIPFGMFAVEKCIKK